MDNCALRLERDNLVLLRRRVRTELPYLRRLARALTGSQRLADMCVVEVMDEVLDSPMFIHSARNPRVALFRRLLETLNNVAVDIEVGLSDVFVSPPQRQAQLLMTVDGFTASETAEILNIDELAVQRLLLTVAAEGFLAGSVSVLIIEDEPLICMQLEQIVLQLGHKVLATAATRMQVSKVLRDRIPDLVLSDVQLADGSSGIDAVRDIQALRQVPVIFITAFPERLLTGRRAEPNFLISKPFDADAVKATLSQALFLNFHQRSGVTAFSGE